MSKCKLSIEFDGFDKMLKDISKMGEKIKPTVESALMKSRDFINKNLDAEMNRHIRTGDTKESLKNAPVKWEGMVAEIPVGFDIGNGGIASIFLMYGTKVFGTPRVKKDIKLYNAIYGKNTKEKVAEIQKKEFEKVLTF